MQATFDQAPTPTLTAPRFAELCKGYTHFELTGRLERLLELRTSSLNSEQKLLAEEVQLAKDEAILDEAVFLDIGAEKRAAMMTLGLTAKRKSDIKKLLAMTHKSVAMADPFISLLREQLKERAATLSGKCIARFQETQGRQSEQFNDLAREAIAHAMLAAGARHGLDPMQIDVATFVTNTLDATAIARLLNAAVAVRRQAIARAEIESDPMLGTPEQA